MYILAVILPISVEILFSMVSVIKIIKCPEGVTSGVFPILVLSLSVVYLYSIYMGSVTQSALKYVLNDQEWLLVGVVNSFLLPNISKGCKVVPIKPQSHCKHFISTRSGACKSDSKANL